MPFPVDLHQLPLATLATRDGVFVALNRAFADLIGWNADELIGKSIADLLFRLVAPRDRAVLEPLARNRESAEPRRHGRLWCRVLTATGEERPMRVEWRLDDNGRDSLVCLVDAQPEAFGQEVSEALARVRWQSATQSARSTKLALISRTPARSAPPRVRRDPERYAACDRRGYLRTDRRSEAALVAHALPARGAYRAALPLRTRPLLRRSSGRGYRRAPVTNPLSGIASGASVSRDQKNCQPRFSAVATVEDFSKRDPKASMPSVNAL